MQVVDQAILVPGQCAVTATGNGPFIDTLREDDRGYRIYVSLDWVQEAAALIGMGTSEQVDGLIARIAELEGAEAEREAVKAELWHLRDSVRRTLAQGAVIKSRDQETGLTEEFGLRTTPGTKTPDLEA